ncbi:hypothetical protein [Methanotorris formicicus]|uniref:hypothetical protein n=1 Tax=Methanotorris formicicus TaxID=213185 RepID=UPI003A4DFBF9
MKSASANAVLNITYKNNTQNINNQPIKTPIPLGVILLTLIVIPLLTLRIIKK